MAKKLSMTAAAATEGFRNIPLGEIVMESQVRSEVDPIDKADGIASSIQTRHPDMDLDGIMSGLITLRRDETRAENGLAPTVGAIVKISGISLSSLRNILSLLRLSEDIQGIIKKGTVPVSQGYIFADHLDNPGLREVLKAFVDGAPEVLRHCRRGR